MAIRDFTLPLDDLGYVVIPEYEREPEPVADVLRKAISRPGTFPLLAAVVRTAINLELPTAFPVVDRDKAEDGIKASMLRLAYGYDKLAARASARASATGPRGEMPRVAPSEAAVAAIDA